MARKSGSFSGEQIEAIKELYNQGLPNNKIIEKLELNCHRDTFVKRIKELGIYKENRKITTSSINDNFEEILDKWKQGISICKLAKEYHLSKTIIANRLRQFGYVVKNEHTKVKFDDSMFDIIDSEEKAYWLGFLYADGNINKHKSSKESYTLVVALKSTDYKHLEKFCNFLNYSNDNIKIINKKLNEKQYQQCRIEVHSKHLWETLNSIGVVPCKSLIVQFPPESTFKNKSLIKHFIRGYFDGDGCLSFYKRTYDIIPHCSFVGTESFIKNSKLYIPYDSIFRVRNYSQAKENYHDLYELVFNKENSELFSDWLYKDATIYLDRKYERYRLFKKYNFEIPYTESKLEEVFGILL